MIKKDSTMIRPGLLILVILVAVPTYTVNGQTHYRQPPADVVAILDAPPPPRATDSWHVESKKIPVRSR